MRARRLGLVLGLLGVLAVAPAASAAAPTTVIRIHIVFGVSETFWTDGSVVCATGSAVSDPVSVRGAGAQGRGIVTFHLIKTLTCADGSGTFQMLVNAAGTRTSPGTVGGFAVVGGTGAYTSLTGAGTVAGTGFDGGIDDVYVGHLSN